MKKEISYSDALAELEGILSNFSNNSMDVDSLACEVKRASELISVCKQRLHKVENEISNILDEKDN